MRQLSCKVLIVDDEPDMAENLARILRQSGYETVVETESRRALACMARE